MTENDGDERHGEREEPASSRLGLDFAAAVDANIGRNLRSARERAGMSQTELARQVTDLGLIGVHQTTIARIEAGKRSLRAAEALAFGRVLETSIEYLAESAMNASLRSAHSTLGQAVEAFTQALRTLQSERWLLAGTLDSRFPYSDDGVASLTTVSAEIDPSLYDHVEETLFANSSPIDLLRYALTDIVRRSESWKIADGGRQELLLQEMAEFLEGGDGERQAEA